MDTNNEDEDEELVPRRRVLFGMKFHDEESRETARKVAYASISLAVLVVVHFIVHLFKKGEVARGLPHLIIGLALPFVGYRSSSLDDTSPWRPRLLWMFHIGNVVFVMVHAVLLLLVCMEVSELESSPTAVMCDQSRQNDPMLRPALTRGPEVLPTLPPSNASYEDCVRDVESEKGHAPGLMMFWFLVSAPYWACAAYAAYHSHDLYLQLRINQLTVRRGTAHGEDVSATDDRIATVSWQHDATPVE
mmetsp:Transcript_92839/g.261626  ORF Transcript_92839/g.261626 Transcript_92839/m.261626 type:complete len:247 (+) Transcript_92839:68-808(+)